VECSACGSAFGLARSQSQARSGCLDARNNRPIKIRDLVGPVDAAQQIGTAEMPRRWCLGHPMCTATFLEADGRDEMEGGGAGLSSGCDVWKTFYEKLEKPIPWIFASQTIRWHAPLSRNINACCQKNRCVRSGREAGCVRPLRERRLSIQRPWPSIEIRNTAYCPADAVQDGCLSTSSSFGCAAPIWERRREGVNSQLPEIAWQQ
jgi:hypothetical protein